MLKAVRLFTLLTLAVAGSAQAAEGYGSAGCGIGSMIIGNKPGFVQVFAATLNGIGYSQLFGISSGTSNCNMEHGKTAEIFIIANRENLESEISRGNGETLASLAEVMGCQDSQALSSKLQGSFSNIFPSANVSSEEVAKQILGAVKSDSALSSSCTI